MTSEPVPRDPAWHATRGIELPRYSDTLTPAEVATINEHYDIELYFGAHGSAYEESPAPVDMVKLLAMSTPREYDAVASVVDSLRPGDALFIENFAHNEETQSLLRQFYEGMSQLPPGKKEVFSQIAADFGQCALRHAEASRQNGTVNAWNYATTRAIWRNIPVIYADLNADEAQALIGGGSERLRALMQSDNQEDRDLVQFTHTQRERKARAVTTDWALRHIPPDDAPPPEQKPRLIVLFGGYHKAGMTSEFETPGLHVAVHSMDTTDDLKLRAIENARTLLGGLAKQIVQEVSSYTASKTVRGRYSSYSAFAERYTPKPGFYGARRERNIHKED